MTVRRASAASIASAPSRAGRLAHRSEVSACRMASPRSSARGEGGGPRRVTSPRSAPMVAMRRARLYWGWSGAPAAASDSSAKAASSMSRSSPGSTTAPSGRRAMAPSRRAVAGSEPVDPAAMTGPAAGPSAASRAASAATSASRRSAASTMPSALRCAAQAVRAMRTKSRLWSKKLSCSSRFRPSSRAQSMPPMAIWSNSAASSSASATVEAGPAATASCPAARAMVSRQRVTRAVSAMRRWVGDTARGAIRGEARSEKASASSSTSPSGTMRGSRTASVPRVARSVCANSRPARRVGR